MTPAASGRRSGAVGGYERDCKWLRKAFASAREAGRSGERPFAAMVVNAGGGILASAVNRQISSGDFTQHAELMALRDAWLNHPKCLSGATLYASSEPCAMCSAGAFLAGIARVVYGTSNVTTYALMPRPGSQLTMSAAAVLGSGDRDIKVIGPVLEEEDLADLRAVQSQNAEGAQATGGVGKVTEVRLGHIIPAASVTAATGHCGMSWPTITWKLCSWC